MATHDPSPPRHTIHNLRHDDKHMASNRGSSLTHLSSLLQRSEDRDLSEERDVCPLGQSLAAVVRGREDADGADEMGKLGERFVQLRHDGIRDVVSKIVPITAFRHFKLDMKRNTKTNIHFTHVLDNADDSDARALAEANLLPHIGERHLLRRGDDDSAVDAHITQEVHNGDVLIGGARRR